MVEFNYYYSRQTESSKVLRELSKMSKSLSYYIRERYNCDQIRNNVVMRIMQQFQGIIPFDLNKINLSRSKESALKGLKDGN